MSRHACVNFAHCRKSSLNSLYYCVLCHSCWSVQTAVLVNIATSGVLAVMLSAFMRCGRAPPAHTAAHAHHHSASDSDGTYAEQRAVEIAALVRFGPSLLSFIAGELVSLVSLGGHFARKSSTSLRDRVFTLV